MRFIVCLWAAASIALAADTPRVVSGAGAITETVCALGAQDQLVAVDISSTYPTEITSLPKVGYARQLSAEGILSTNPTVVFVNEDAGPPEVLTQLEQAKVNVVKLPNDHTPEAAKERILKVGEALGRQEQAEALVAKITTDLEQAQAKADEAKSKPRILFIYTRGASLMNVSGAKTGADRMIALAGGENAVTGYDGYKPLTPEGAVTAAPDVILVTAQGVGSLGGVQDLLKQPGLSLTPAGKAGRVVVMDDLLLLGFGPRLGQAALELNEKIHAQAASDPQ